MQGWEEGEGEREGPRAPSITVASASRLAWTPGGPRGAEDPCRSCPGLTDPLHMDEDEECEKAAEQEAEK